MSPTKKQYRKAARIWALAFIAHTESFESEIRRIACEDARRKLAALGYDQADLLTEDDCLNAALSET